MKKQLFLIQGLFFTPDYLFGIVNDPEIGSRATVQRGITFAMYAGVLDIPTESTTPGTGILQDRYGISELANVVLNEAKLTFIKKYEKRDDSIEYNFRKEGTIWIGSYNGSYPGVGASRCVLTPIEENFFSPEGLEEFLREAPELNM